MEKSVPLIANKANEATADGRPGISRGINDCGLSVHTGANALGTTTVGLALMRNS